MMDDSLFWLKHLIVILHFLFPLKTTPINYGHYGIENKNIKILINYPWCFILDFLAIYKVTPLKEFFYSSCCLGKSKSISFSNSTHISTFAFVLVHSHVWTAPMISSSGYKYFVTFVDDYGYLDLFTMLKVGSFGSFQNFCADDWKSIWNSNKSFAFWYRRIVYI